MPLDSLRAIARTGRRTLRRSRVKLFRRLGLIKGDWNANLPAELKFWDRALQENGRNWDQAEWRNCLNPDYELSQELTSLIPAPVGSTVRILDVGSGPLTRVGKRWDGRKVEIVPTDPLAEEYNALLARHGVRPLVPPVFAHGEKLLEHFEANSFDLAHASNSLDHAYDPLLIIRQMLALVKPEHYVYLWHVANEGVRESYSGLHQWNFDIRKGEFVVDDGRQTQSVTATLQGQAIVTCEFRTAYNARIVVAKLKKLV